MTGSGPLERRSQSRARQSATLAPDWKALLDDARTERAVVRATQDYLATWTPQEMHALPEECRPGQIKGGDEISFWAFELTRIHCETSDPAAAVLIVKMMTFFSHASERLSKLQTIRDTPAAGNDS
jgi:hypothetical protein